jgi:hypothetical protein
VVFQQGKRSGVVNSFDCCFFLSLWLPVLHPGPCPSLREPEPWKEKVLFSKKIIETISYGCAKVKVGRGVSIGNVTGELFVCIKK